MSRARARKKKPLVARATVFRAYPIVRRAVEEGIRYGWTRAHKHIDTPDADVVQEHLERAVMEALDEVFDYGDGVER